MPIKSNVTDRRHRNEKFKRVITLVSGGFANPTAFPKGEITVLPWDSNIDNWLDENASTRIGADRDRLMFDLMAKLCNLNGCPVEDFVLGDVNTVLLSSRSITERNKLIYTTTCPACGTEDQSELNVPEDLQPIAAKPADYKGYDLVTLADAKDIVAVRPLRVRDTLTILGRTPEAKKLIDDHMAHAVAPIVTINDTQPDRIEELVEWHNSLSPHDVKQLEEFVENNTPHLNMRVVHQCDNAMCKNVYDHKLVIDQEFFRSGRMGTPRRALAANI
jgi:hypothetical protein